MYLKSLSLCGFKSFADRTVFEFGPGLTAVVGPNGCGKSNVVDALKWVLGDQSPKSLRGTEMLDVIFNGSQHRKPMGFAEVTLTFADVGRTLGVDYEEVSITRRLYRSGESEYRINKTQCRLRDIRELFMDTGVGMSSYSIIEQGKIAALLTANAQQRRQIFEEAAGISRYKWKAKEAERRLERVQLNLNRLGDLVREVERQLNSVQRQAQKARRYQDLSDRLKEARIGYGLHVYHRLHGATAEVSGRIVELENRKAELAAELGTLEERLTQSELLLRDLGERLRAAYEQIAQLDTTIQTAEHRISHNKDVVAESGELAHQAAGRAASAQEVAAEILVDLEAARARLGEARAAEAAAVAAREGAEAEAARQRTLQDAARQQLQEAGQTLDQVAAESADARNALTAANAAARELGAEHARRSARHEELSTQRTTVDAAVQSAAAQAGEIRRTVEGWRARFQEAQATAQATAAAEQQCVQTLETARERTTAARSRRDVLASVRDRLEGVPAGARDLVQGGDRPGLLGLLADRLEIEPTDAPAIEAALGHLAGGVVCATAEEAWTLLDILSERGLGRGVVVPAANGDATVPPEDGPVPPLPGVVGWARTLVRCDATLAPLRDRLLAGVLVVESRAVARTIPTGTASRIVTRSGELLAADHAVGGPQGAGPLAARAELSRLETELHDLERVLTEATAAREQAQVARRDAEAAVEDLRGRILEGTYQLQEYEAQLAAVSEQRNALDRELEVLTAEITQCDARLAEAERARSEAEAIIDACAQREAAARASLAAAKEAGSAATVALDAAVRAASDRRVEEATAREKLRSEESAVPTLTERHTEKLAEAERQQAQAQRERERATNAAAAITADEQALAAALNDREQRREGAVALEEDRKGAEAQAAEIRTAIQGVRSRQRDVDDALTQQRVDEAEKRKELEYQVTSLRNAYGVDLAELHRGWDASTAPDADQLELEVTELEGKLGRLGGVNHDALGELDELTERHAFLTAQQEDLQSAQQSLGDIIRRIKKKSREMFLETFATVRQNFQVLFRKLFGGGAADIVLEDESLPLETGIEIKARPPGKEPRSISLLSGGEKSMTCVGVVFAIYMSRPSPFCILDEVDAALDEANIDRFINVLKEFVVQSQFLIITHRKPTMAAAEAIYGVTMPEGGVSRPISMKLEDAVAHSEAPDVAPAPSA